MDKLEASKLVAVVTATYPGYFRSYSTADINNMVSAWYRVLGDIPYEQADAGLTVFLRSDTKGFPPSPGQILNCVISVTEKQEDRIGELEAWSMVMQALRNSGDLARATKEFNALPGIVRATIGRPENLRQWAVDENFSVEVAQGIFLRQFANMQRRIQSEKQMTSSTNSPRLEAKAQLMRYIEDGEPEADRRYGWSEERTKSLESLRNEFLREAYAE